MVYPKELEHFLFDTPMKIGIWLTLLYVIDIKIVIDMWLSSCVNTNRIQIQIDTNSTIL